MADAINPSHYKQGKVECIDAIESATVHKTGLEAFCVGNVIKYIWRYEAKNGLEDCKKARYYLDKLITCLEAKEKKPIQHFAPTDNYVNAPYFPNTCEAVAGNQEDVKIYNTPQDIIGTLKTDNNNKICLD